MLVFNTHVIKNIHHYALPFQHASQSLHHTTPDHEILFVEMGVFLQSGEKSEPLPEKTYRRIKRQRRYERLAATSQFLSTIPAYKEECGTLRLRAGWAHIPQTGSRLGVGRTLRFRAHLTDRRDAQH